MGVEDLAKTAEKIRRRWRLGAAAVVHRNWTIMRERVNRELEGLEKAKSKAVLSKLDEQIKAAGVDPADYYATMKERERRLGGR